jgi:hypothetical protein
MSASTPILSATPLVDHDCGWAIVQRRTGSVQQGLFSHKAFSTGSVLCRFSAAARFTQPNRLTIQTAETEHIHLLPACLSFTNHSCTPTVFFNMQSFELEALQAIQPGDELTFFYPSTEWDMAEQFACSCGSPQCLGKIRGARYLPASTLNRYRLNEFIKHLL